jgi:hypothetical protein
MSFRVETIRCASCVIWGAFAFSGFGVTPLPRRATDTVLPSFHSPGCPHYEPTASSALRLDLAVSAYTSKTTVQSSVSSLCC